MGQAKQRKAAGTYPNKDDVREGNERLLEILRGMKGARDERGLPLASQTQEMIDGGWLAIGYLMISPQLHSDGGLMGRKRVACDAQSAAEVDKWFSERLQEGFTPGFRCYISRACPVKNSEFNGVIVHRGLYEGYDVILEFIPGSSSTRTEAVGFLAKATARLLDAASVALEFAVLVDVALKGGTISIYNSREKEMMN
jgi:hypothetical protein